jgi:hypothetical protein
MAMLVPLIRFSIRRGGGCSRRYTSTDFINRGNDAGKLWTSGTDFGNQLRGFSTPAAMPVVDPKTLLFYGRKKQTPISLQVFDNLTSAS